jgi:hypothetical protein
MVDIFVEAQCLVAAACFEEMLQFGESRDLGRAEQARDREGAARIGIGAAGFELLIPQPAAQEAGEEGVTGTKDVIDLDGKAWTFHAVIQRIRNGAGKHDAAHGAALAHDGGLRDRADRTDRYTRILGPARDVQFFLRADHEIAIGKDGLQVLRHRIGAHVARLAGSMAEKTPEIGAVIDVEHHLAAVRLGDADRLSLRSGGCFT